MRGTGPQEWHDPRAHSAGVVRVIRRPAGAAGARGPQAQAAASGRGPPKKKQRRPIGGEAGSLPVFFKRRGAGAPGAHRLVPHGHKRASPGAVCGRGARVITYPWLLKRWRGEGGGRRESGGGERGVACFLSLLPISSLPAPTLTRPRGCGSHSAAHPPLHVLPHSLGPPDRHRGRERREH